MQKPSALLLVLAATSFFARPGLAEPPRASSDGLAMLRLLRGDADRAFAPTSGHIGALFELPPGVRGSDLGVDEVSPGIGRIRGTSAQLQGFAQTHPGLRLEVAPPLRLLNDRIGRYTRSAQARVDGIDGTGVYTGIADTGLDVTHPDFLDENGKSRVAWLLDLSQKPRGVYPDVEKAFQITLSTGEVRGAVFAGTDIDAIIADPKKGPLPQDLNGHGTHVASIAAGNGGLGANKTGYVGMAPKSKLVVVRLTRGTYSGIETDDLVTAARFIFDRADADKKAAVVNMSLGTDFGPHDGSLLWERTLAANVGPDKPGHVIVAAAGNSGSIDDPIHQSVYVSPGTKMRVPLFAPDAAVNGRVQIWITKRKGANLDVGLEGPDGEWIAPIGPNSEQGKNTDGYNAGIFQGASDRSPVPEGSNGAVVVWSGAWPAGTYNVTLEGNGVAELYMQTYGDADGRGHGPVRFVAGVREGTINLPASHPSIIGVGCTINRARWHAVTGADIGPVVPGVDSVGGLPTNQTRDPAEGEICWFSSAGPNALGTPKPEIAAPGGAVVAAMSGQAKPGEPQSIFTNPGCPLTKTGASDLRCLQVDDRHAVSSGTSMSSPVVAGAVALLLQKDPTLTQDKVVALLQAGAHAFRGAAPFQAQSGPGEVDAIGSLDALARMNTPALALPARDRSWISLSVDHVAADGSTPVVAYVELRTADGAHGADLFESNRLQPVVLIDNVPVTTPVGIARKAPGLFTFTYTAPPGLGGRTMTFGASFDNAEIVAPRSIPVAADGWRASYGSSAKGSCGVAGVGTGGTGGVGAGLGLGLLGLALARRRRFRS